LEREGKTGDAGACPLSLRNSTKGFSLTELLIAVAIILIIAAIVIPNLHRSRFVVDGVSSVGCLRTLNTDEATYSPTNGVGYSPTLGYLAPPPAGNSPTSTAAGLIDSILAGARADTASSIRLAPLTPPVASRFAKLRLFLTPTGLAQTIHLAQTIITLTNRE
jgi:prepilin-type N-terminal cleavage/methylation domain-containing protein